MTVAVQTVGDLLAARGAHRGAEPALEHGERVLSYADLHLGARARAAALARHGVMRGDRVVIGMQRGLDCLLWFFGTLELGAVAVLLNDGLTKSQIEHIVGHSGARLAVAGPRQRTVLTDAGLGAVAVIDGEAQVDPSLHESRTETRSPTGSDLAVLMYTSGSTGQPKGVMVTHANLLAGARIVAQYLGLGSHDRTLSVLPWGFDVGLNQVLNTLWAGGTVVICGSTFAPEICRVLSTSNVTGLAGVPPLWELLTRGPSTFLDLELPALRYVTNTGGPLRPETLARIRRSHPKADVFLMFGLTEAFRSTYLPPTDLEARPGSIGRAIPDTEILVLDADGNSCAPGDVGELVHRGPTVAAGYWNDRAATERVFRPLSGARSEGPSEYVVHSGDYVYSDADGYLYVVGRRDEQFKSRGVRVNPQQIEAGLIACGFVAEAVVYHVPDSTGSGEGDIAAAVVWDEKASAPDRDALAEYCWRSLPAYHQPTIFDVFPAFPRTSSGKIDRSAIKAYRGGRVVV